jgi:hypothetical protein
LQYWGLGFELRASHSQGRCSVTGITLPALFARVILGQGLAFLLMLAETEILLFYTSCCHWDDDGYMPQCLAFFQWTWGLVNFFCSGWPGIMILPISASRVAWMSGTSHHTQLWVEIGRQGSHKLFTQLVWNHDHPDFSLLSTRMICVSHQRPSTQLNLQWSMSHNYH